MQESAIKAAASFRPRKILTKHDAIEIYRMKHEHGFPTEHAASCFLAEKYKVSSKAIRDIWSGRTWRDKTLVLRASSHRICCAQPAQSCRRLLGRGPLNSRLPLHREQLPRLLARCRATAPSPRPGRKLLQRNSSRVRASPQQPGLDHIPALLSAAAAVLL